MGGVASRCVFSVAGTLFIGKSVEERRGRVNAGGDFGVANDFQARRGWHHAILSAYRRQRALAI